MKALTWRSVTGGMIAATVIAVIIFVVLAYARAGALRGDKFLLYVAVPDASNLLPGSDVWLNGQRVGTVTSIDFAPATVDQEVRVVIGAEVLKTMRNNIRFDSRASLRTGGTVIGAPVVYLTAGTMAARAVVPGDTLRGVGKSDFEIAASRATEALAEMPAVMSDAKIIAANARGAGARLSAIMNADRGQGSFSEQASALRAKLTSDRGSAARLMRDREIRRRIANSMAQTDSLRLLVTARMNEVGQFRRDSTLARNVKSLLEEVAVIRELATSSTGTVGRLATDSALVRAMDSVFIELGALMADIKKNPLRYARVF